MPAMAEHVDEDSTPGSQPIRQPLHEQPVVAQVFEHLDRHLSAQAVAEGEILARRRVREVRIGASV